MAEGALLIVAEGIIGQLGNLDVKELGLLWGLKEEHQKLVDAVSTIKAVIVDAEEQQAQNHTIKNWLGRLKDALYEADDLLDDLSTEVLRREVMTRNKKAKEVRIFFSKSNQLAYGLKMGHKIQAIRERLDAIAEDGKKFHLYERLRETQVTNPIRETGYFVFAKDFIGREVDKKVIIERLLDSNIEENVSVYSIVGLGGVGKTTLAQLVFNDEEIQKEFERKFWVRISDDFDVKIFVEKILEYAKGKKPENLEMNTLINDLQKEIDGKRFLLVLDDVWNEDSEKWDKLKEILLAGARGSRILVTTREEKVAESSKTIETHRLTGLNDEESWSLFKQKAFKYGREPVNPKFKEIGMEIISKCKGVPLAIKIIGSLLSSKNSEEEWLFFKNNELSKVNETSILPILRLSYDHLPPHLKQCFAYCSLFPKDYEFEKEKLIKLWMAQGFIRPSGQNQCLEDVGHEYFMELLWKSFFQEDTRSIFKIHDLMHDLAILVAGLESTTFEINWKNIEEKTYHVSFGFNLGSSKQIPTLLFKANRMRTFLLPCQELYSNQMVWSQLTFDAFVSSFKFLRLLDLHATGIINVPHSIKKLKHLRYLDLSENQYIKILPSSITRLQNLETLNLFDCKELIELPKNISKLVNLRHLNIDRCYSLTHMPRGFGQLTNLQSLGQYVLSTDSRYGVELKELEGLKQLRENLRIKILRHGKDAELVYKAVNLEKQHLQGLALEWIESEVDVGYNEMLVKALEPNQNLQSLELNGYRGVKYPSWLFLLKNLVRLELCSMKNSQDGLPLYQFPSLKTLRLDHIPSLEYVSLVSESFKLPPLESLGIWFCPNLKGWWKRSDSIEEDEDAADNYGEISTITAKNHSLPSFSRLSKLTINGCPKLSFMPLFPYLERLYLQNSNLRPLEQTISMGMRSMASQENPTAAAVAESTSSARSYSSSTLAASFTPLSKFKSLVIYMIEGSDGHFLQSIQHLTALEYFSLLNYNGDGMELEWQGLRKLQYLTLCNNPKLASLPVGLQQATSLRHLGISYCPSLTTLPGWICEIISLQSLSIWDCPNLTSLPALMSLKTLEIRSCPILVESCKNQDWLARIKNLEGDLAPPKEEDPEQTWGFTKNFRHCSGSTSQ